MLPGHVSIAFEDSTDYISNSFYLRPNLTGLLRLSCNAFYDPEQRWIWLSALASPVVVISSRHTQSSILRYPESELRASVLKA